MTAFETFTMSEADIKKLVRNSLMVAGHEMGETGDHWPVIKKTITDLMGDWEKLDASRAARAEMGRQLYAQLHEMETLLQTLPPEEQTAAAPHLAELRELYDALFEEPAERTLDLGDAQGQEEDNEDGTEAPLHIRRAAAIIETLREDDHD